MGAKKSAAVAEKKKKPASDEQQKPDIPRAVEPGAIDLNKLAAIGTEKAGDEVRAELRLNDAQLAKVARWAALVTLLDTVNAAEQSEYESLKLELADLYMAQLLALKTKPANPKLITKLPDGKIDVQASYIVKEVFNVQVPQLAKDETAKQAVMKILIEDFEPEVAAKLINEIDFTPNVVIRPVKHLLYGHYKDKEWIDATETEKSAVGKLINWVQNSPDLSAEEKAALIEVEQSATVRKGFLHRVTEYATTLPQVKAIWRLFKPQHQVSHAKYGMSSSETEKIDRLLASSKEVLGKADLSGKKKKDD